MEDLLFNVVNVWSESYARGPNKGRSTTGLLKTALLKETETHCSAQIPSDPCGEGCVMFEKRMFLVFIDCRARSCWDRLWFGLK